MRTPKAQVWVVYLMPMKNRPGGVRAVCRQPEWEALEGARPGYYTLVRAGLTNEGEAERLARGSAGATIPRGPKAILAAWPGELAAVPFAAKPPAAG